MGQQQRNSFGTCGTRNNRIVLLSATCTCRVSNLSPAGPIGTQTFSCGRPAGPLVVLWFFVWGPLAGFDWVDVNRLAIERACNGYIHSSVVGGLALRLQHVDMMAHPQAIFRPFTYTTVDAFLIRGHILCDLAIRAAMGIGDIALPCLLQPGALCAAASLQKHYDELEQRSCHCSFGVC